LKLWGTLREGRRGSRSKLWVRREERRWNSTLQEPEEKEGEEYYILCHPQ